MYRFTGWPGSVLVMELVVHEDREQAAEGSARRIAETMSAALLEGDDIRFTLGLAGGSTPAATYRGLRGRAAGWQRVDAWLSDERWVPPDDERSNGRMAAETLLDHVDARFFRPHWSEFIEPEDAAAHYEAKIRSIHHERAPDLILAGMGEDGHTVSLFPGSPALEEESRWYVATEHPQTREPRLTATYPLLWTARMIIVLAVGEAKAEALAASFRGETPAGRLGDGDAEVEWHVDAAAASLLA